MNRAQRSLPDSAPCQRCNGIEFRRRRLRLSRSRTTRVKCADQSERSFSEERAIIEAIMADEIKPDSECRRVTTSGQQSNQKEQKWKKVSDSLAKSSFAIRTLFQPVWAHSLRGAEIGAALGLIYWFGSGAFMFLSRALALAPFSVNRSAAGFTYFFAASLVCIFWLVNFVHLFSQAALPKSFQTMTAKLSNKAFGGVVMALVLVGINASKNPGGIEAIFPGLFFGLRISFGAFIAGALAGLLPGMIIGTFIGMTRKSNLPKAPSIQEAVTPVLIKGIFLPAVLLTSLILLYFSYSSQLAGYMQQALETSP